MPNRTLTAIALTAALTSPAVSADSNAGGYYLKAIGGAGWLADADLDSRTQGAGEAAFDAGFSGGAALGYDFGRWLAEVELVYRTNTLDRVRGTSFDGADDGDFSSLGVGLNGAYQFNLLGNPAVQSYAGAGIVWFQEIDIDFEGEGPERSYSGDDIGIQVFLGARYALNDRWSLHAEARYLTASGIEMDGEGAAPGSFEADYDRTSVTAGLSYRF